jgi:hypothetical protein
MHTYTTFAAAKIQWCFTFGAKIVAVAAIFLLQSSPKLTAAGNFCPHKHQKAVDSHPVE